MTVRFDNRSRDRRLRAWFPLLEPATTSAAECAFGIVERGLDAEGGPSETAMATQPSRRFVCAGGLTIAHEGLVEYELVDVQGEGGDRAAHALALTLVRSTGMLSQIPMATRPLPAGPFDAAEGAQLQGPLELRYAVHLAGRDPYAVTEDAFVPLQVVGTTKGDGPSTAASAASDSLLSVTGAEVSALRRLPARPEVLELRVFNPTASPTTVTVEGRTGRLVDLRGDGDDPFDGELHPSAVGHPDHPPRSSSLSRGWTSRPPFARRPTWEPARARQHGRGLGLAFCEQTRQRRLVRSFRRVNSSPACVASGPTWCRKPSTSRLSAQCEQLWTSASNVCRASSNPSRNCGVSRDRA